LRVIKKKKKKYAQEVRRRGWGQRWLEGRGGDSLQGYLAHKKTPTPL